MQHIVVSYCAKYHEANFYVSVTFKMSIFLQLTKKAALSFNHTSLAAVLNWILQTWNYSPLANIFVPLQSIAQTRLEICYINLKCRTSYFSGKILKTFLQLLLNFFGRLALQLRPLCPFPFKMRRTGKGILLFMKTLFYVAYSKVKLLLSPAFTTILALFNYRIIQKSL